MRVTQTDIAKRVGLDVSSVNKIINRVPGLAFRNETVAQVFKVARELDYSLDVMSKGNIANILRKLFPPNITPDELRLHLQKIPNKELREIQKRLYRSA